MTTGTHIEVFGFDFDGTATFEAAVIARWTKISGPRMDGWHIVRFADGGKLMCHESRFRVVDNRAAR